MKKTIVSASLAYIVSTVVASFVENLSIHFVIITGIILSTVYCVIKKFKFESVILLSCLIAFTSYSLHYQGKETTINNLNGVTAQITGKVISVEQKGNSKRITADAQTELSGKTEKFKTAFMSYNNQSVKVGDVIHYESILEKPVNKGFFDSEQFYETENIYLISKPKNFEVTFNSKRFDFSGLRNQLKSSTKLILGDRYSTVLDAVIYGDKKAIDEKLEKEFQKIGVAHILVVSGLHISIIIGIILSLTKKLKLRKYRFLIVILVVVFYSGIVGMTVSLKRVLGMFLVLVVGNLLGRRVTLLNAVTLTAVILLVLNPFIIKSVSFQLSFTAIISIYLSDYYTKRTMNKIELQNIFFSKWAKNVTFAVYLSLFMIPILSFYFNQVNALSFIPNLLILPILAPIIISGFLVSILANFKFYLTAKIFSFVTIFFIEILLLIKDICYKFLTIEICFPDNSLLTLVFAVTFIIAFVVAIFNIRKFSSQLVLSFVILSELTYITLNLTAPNVFVMSGKTAEQSIIYFENKTENVVISSMDNDYNILELASFLTSLGKGKIDVLIVPQVSEDTEYVAERLESEINIENIILLDDDTKLSNDKMHCIANSNININDDMKIETFKEKSNVAINIEINEKVYTYLSGYINEELYEKSDVVFSSMEVENREIVNLNEDKYIIREGD